MKTNTAYIDRDLEEGNVELDLKEDEHCLPGASPGGGERGAGAEGRSALPTWTLPWSR